MLAPIISITGKQLPHLQLPTGPSNLTTRCNPGLGNIWPAKLVLAPEASLRFDIQNSSGRPAIPCTTDVDGAGVYESVNNGTAVPQPHVVKLINRCCACHNLVLGFMFRSARARLVQHYLLYFIIFNHTYPCKQ